MTYIERDFWEMLPSDLKKISKVSLSFLASLQSINGNLISVFGERANWERNLKRYQKRCENDAAYAALQDGSDARTITMDDVQVMLDEEALFRERTAQLLELQKDFSSADAKTWFGATVSAAALLGFVPGKDGLFSWMVDPQGQSEREAKELMTAHIKELNIAVRTIIDTFRAGLQLTYPIIETAMTQPKPQYYYRGENALFGRSAPSLYRNNGGLPRHIQWMVSKLRLNEGCQFLDQFDAVRLWGNSNINYVALAQHYGLRTPMMDFSGSFLSSLFFACCKYGKDGKWRPLEKKDFEERDSRPWIARAGGDSRYGMIYRGLAEAFDLEMLVEKADGENTILPIGYQPFMRCAHQHGYMLLTRNDQYDLYKDGRFEKYKIRLTEEMCRWIYDEMDEGRKIYPPDDVPDLSAYFQEINELHHFSQSSFEGLSRALQLHSENRKEAVVAALNRYGFHILAFEKKHISENKLRKINRKYTIHRAFALTQAQPYLRPHLII